MQKVYTVLKNNKQEGPYNLHELKQIDLQPTDLIWVEGRSAAWCYPAEIKELQEFHNTEPLSSADAREEPYAAAPAPETLKKEAKKVFVSLPGGKEKMLEKNVIPRATNIEEKAEALRQRILSNQAPAPKTSDEVAETRLQRSMDDVAGDFANWAIQNKARKQSFQNNKKKIAFAAFVLIVVVAIGYHLFPDTPSKNTISEREEQPITEDIIVPEDANPDPVFENTAPASIEKETVLNQSNRNITPDLNIQREKTKPAVIGKAQQEPANIERTEPVYEEKMQEIIPEKEPEKKKSIGEAIDGFFDKFKNKNKEGEATAKNSEGRQSTKRTESENATPEAVDVTSQVKVSTNAPAENWMLGIKGQKLTLQNNSKTLIQSAWILVEYFSEDETLLDTKKIEFKNVKPSQKAIQPLPDHRLASYTTQQVITATGIMQ